MVLTTFKGGGGVCFDLMKHPISENRHIEYPQLLDFACGECKKYDDYLIRRHLSECEACALLFETIIEETEVELNRDTQRFLQRIPGINRLKKDPTALAMIAYDENMEPHVRIRALRYLARSRGKVAGSAIAELSRELQCQC